VYNNFYFQWKTFAKVWNIFIGTIFWWKIDVLFFLFNVLTRAGRDVPNAPAFE
jgi:hypothetical protein